MRKADKRIGAVGADYRGFQRMGVNQSSTTAVLFDPHGSPQPIPGFQPLAMISSMVPSAATASFSPDGKKKGEPTNLFKPSSGSQY